MKTLSRMVCGHTVRRSMVAVLIGMSIAGGTAHAQQVGPAGGRAGGGPTWGIGRGGSAGNEKYPPPATVRAVQGKVENSKGEALKGAMVYLKNDRTAKIQSVTVDETGKFRFVEVPLKDDYKLWAVAAEKKSPEKVISSFDTKTEVTRDLKVE